jgi:hypothetical protein
MSDAEFVTCPACGMGWLTRRLCGSCAFKATPDPGCAECGGKVVYGLTKAHACPEPYPRETAETLAAFYASSGVPTTQREKARILLGLRDE